MLKLEDFIYMCDAKFCSVYIRKVDVYNNPLFNWSSDHKTKWLHELDIPTELLNMNVDSFDLDIKCISVAYNTTNTIFDESCNTIVIKVV